MGFQHLFLRFFCRYILRQNKETVGDSITNIDILLAHFKQFRNFKKLQYSSLQPPNSKVLFPLPNRWTNSDYTKSLQAPHLFSMQIQYTVGVPADKVKAVEIESAKDKSLANLRLLKNLRFTDPIDSKTLHSIASVYTNDLRYNMAKQVILGQSMINGQNPYLIRKFNSQVTQYFLGQNSRKIEDHYQQKIRETFLNQQYNQQNLKEAGFTKEQLIQDIQKGSNVYSMFFQHLEEMSGGHPMKHTPNILFGNQEIKDTYYLQTPYPIFVKVSNNDREGWICVGVAFRYKPNQISVFSPFFKQQPYKVWKLATSQMLQAYFNDFHIRVHLGLLHLTSVQYNVPMYNALVPLNKDGEQFKRMNYFLDEAYTLFNDGLEQVNLTGTQTLLHPIVEYSLLNKVFNFSQQNCLNLMANFSNNLDITKVNPETFLKQNGLTPQDIQGPFDQLSLCLELNSIIQEYVDKMYDLCIKDEDQKLFFDQINRETPNMGAGNFYSQKRHRPMLQQPKDLRALVKNLAFCWCNFHAHTFTTMPFGQYWAFRPSMLKLAVPQNPNQWDSIIEGAELPHPKVMMSTSQLIGGVSAKDPDNMLVNIMCKKYLELEAKLVETKDPKEIDFIEKRKEIYQHMYDRLVIYGQRVDEINKKREEKKLPQLNWMNPSILLASLNI